MTIMTIEQPSVKRKMTEYFKVDKRVFNSNYWCKNDRKEGIVIESEMFPKTLRYVIKENSIILLSGNNGAFCFDLEAGNILLKEINEIIECYKK